MKPEISIATVTFSGDLRLTVLQILSVDRLFDLTGVGEYVVVANDADPAPMREELERHLEGRISNELRGKLRIIERADIPRGGSGQGWRGQQVIKLALCEIVVSEHYLMLDAKNHFVRESSVDDFFHEGKPKTFIKDTTSNWTKYVKASLEAMDGLTEERLARKMPTTTPYMFITREVQALIARLDAKYDRPIDKAMQQTTWSTEFFLYYAHLVTTYDELPYADMPPLNRTLYTSWPQDHKQAMSMIEEAAAGEVPMFGLHRKRLPQLSQSQQAAITSMWRGCGLLKDWEDADWFMEYA